MADIFISYAREDEARIRPLVDAFEARGWSVFWDRRIPAGETWRSYIGAALQAARCLVVAWSEHSVQSQWVAEEGEEGRARGILVPVLLDPVQPPRGFREIQAADLTGLQSGQASARLDELLGDLARRLGASEAIPQAVPTPASPPARLPHAAPAAEVAARAPSVPLAMRWVIVAVIVAVIAGLGWWAWRSPDVERRPVPVAPVAPDAPGRRAPTMPEAEAAWCVVAGSFPRRELEAAERRHLQAQRAELPARLLDSNDYPPLTPDLWVVCVGPFGSRDAANELLPRVRSLVPDAYVKRAR
jgi:hypothetical protein